MLTKWSLPLRDPVVLLVLSDLRDLTVGRAMTDHKVYAESVDYPVNLDPEDSEENLASKGYEERLGEMGTTVVMDSKDSPEGTV